MKMNKAFLAVMLIVVFVMFGSHQAWAMGKRHSSGTFGSGDHPGFSWNNGNPGGNGNSGVNNFSGPNGNDNKQCDFPAGVTVPEPATMLLMGGALAGGMLLRRKQAA
jgi:hypothetical protein